jgi:hypothetical protein
MRQNNSGSSLPSTPGVRFSGPGSIQNISASAPLGAKCCKFYQSFRWVRCKVGASVSYCIPDLYGPQTASEPLYTAFSRRDSWLIIVSFRLCSFSKLELHELSVARRTLTSPVLVGFGPDDWSGFRGARDYVSMSYYRLLRVPEVGMQSPVQQFDDVQLAYLLPFRVLVVAVSSTQGHVVVPKN